MTTTCPKDPSHQSDDPDYCSVCGAKIQGGSVLSSASFASAAPAASASTGGAETCPDCGTPRNNNGRFCEVCRFNFETRASGVAPPVVVAMPLAPEPAPAPMLVAEPAPVSVAPAPPAAPISPAAPPAPSVVLDAPAPPTPAIAADGSLIHWEISAIVDGSLYAEPDPNVPLPANEPERVFPLDFAEMLIGRRSDRKDIHPEIPLADPGISHRHAKLQRQPDGNFILLDVGSTNGTQLNGVDVQPGVRLPLHDGDEITLGCWTRITLHARQAQP